MNSYRNEQDGTALPIVSFEMVLVFLLMHSIAIFLRLLLFVKLLLLFTKNGKGYGGVLCMAVTGSTKKYISQ